MSSAREWLWAGVACLALGPAAGGLPGRARAAELRVLSAGAMRAIVAELAVGFEQETGHRVSIVAGTAGEVQRRAESESADVVIATDAVLADLGRAGLVVDDTRADLARTAVGLGTLRGAAPLDLSSPDALRRALLAARAIAYPDPANGATAGIHMAAVLERLGIAGELKARTRLRASGAASCEAVAQGEAELVVTQISEILADPRVSLVGPLPPELQKLTVYSGGVSARSASPAAARAFLARLRSAAHGERLAKAGLDFREDAGVREPGAAGASSAITPSGRP
jgi:molybdate transport system substrate-binding protein